MQTDSVISIIEGNQNIQKLQEREDIHIVNTEDTEKKKEVQIQTIQDVKRCNTRKASNWARYRLL